jgi:mRNA interferase YafQ
MKLSHTNQFKKDMKKQIKRGKNPKKIIEAVEILLSEMPLSEKYKDHRLKGNWKGRRDCHLEPDWILIYKIDNDELRLERTGTHSDLF